jgi:hypothetical protein
MGPAYIYSYGTGAGGADTLVGETFGGFTLTQDMTTQAAMRDSNGEDASDLYVVAQPSEVDAPFTAMGLSLLFGVIPGCTIDANKVQIQVNSLIGQGLRQFAKTYVIKQFVSGVPTTNKSDWVWLPLAVPIPQVKLAIKVKEQKVWMIKYHCFKPTAADVATGGVLAGKGFAAGVAIQYGSTTV